jgi:transcriptional regulator with XRE-family HTH domain
MTIGERLRAFRVKKLWTTRKAAEFFGVSQSEIWRLESGKNKTSLINQAKWEKLLDKAEKEVK